MRAHTYGESRRDIAFCTTCFGAEGSLSEHCPGSPTTEAEREAIYQAELDYVDGQWLAGKRLAEYRERMAEMRARLVSYLRATGNGRCEPNRWSVVEGVWMLVGPWGCYPTEHPETLPSDEALAAELRRVEGT